MKISEQAHGKWPSILARLGVDEDCLTGKHTPCPVCGGVDRFRFSNFQGKGDFICSQHGSGDGFDLLQAVNGWDFATTAKEVEQIVNNVPATPIKTGKTPDQARADLNRIRKRCHPITQQIKTYLRNRGINDQTINALSIDVCGVNGLEYFKAGQISGRYTAMVCKVKKLGKPITYHITYLDKGNKANVPNPRKVMTPTQKSTGSVVELFDHSVELGVAEGIETAMSAYQLFGVPTWATLNANNMEQFTIPAGVKKLWVFGDNDSSMTGQRAATILEHKAQYQGLEVVRMIPADTDQDWNDVLLAELRAKESA